MSVLTSGRIAPALVEVRRGAIGALGARLAEGGISPRGRVAIVVGAGVGDAVASQLAASLPTAPVLQVVGATMQNACGLVERLRVLSCDAVVGIGGGGTIDVAKYAACEVDRPFVSVATNLAHDGIASPVAVLESGRGRESYRARTPIGVVVDLDFVAGSPIEHTRSGIGDVVSNLSAVADWALAGIERAEPVQRHALALARAAAEAVLHQRDPLDSSGFLSVLGAALVMSGGAMAMAGSSRPCSGACHEIAHAIDALHPGTAPHGELVAVGTMFACFLRKDSAIGAINACFRRYGVARAPADLGLSNRQFAEAVVMAPSTRPDRYTILEHVGLSSIQIRREVDAFVESFDA